MKTKIPILRRDVDCPNLEIRTVDDAPVIEMYAATTGQSYKVGFFEERIEPGAFKNSLSKNPDVVALYEHTGVPLARTNAPGKEGSMTLWEDDKGLAVRIIPNLERPDAKSLYHAVKDGNVDSASFSFRARRDEWSKDRTKRRVLEVEINGGDVSIARVSRAANPNAKAEARCLQCDIKLPHNEVNEGEPSSSDIDWHLSDARYRLRLSRPPVMLG